MGMIDITNIQIIAEREAEKVVAQENLLKTLLGKEAKEVDTQTNLIVPKTLLHLPKAHLMTLRET